MPQPALSGHRLGTRHFVPAVQPVPSGQAAPPALESNDVSVLVEVAAQVLSSPPELDEMPRDDRPAPVSARHNR